MFLSRKTGWVEILTVHGSLVGLAAIQARLIRRGQTMPWPPEKYCFADVTKCQSWFALAKMVDLRCDGS
jgi:hypothetical protein